MHAPAGLAEKLGPLASLENQTSQLKQSLRLLRASIREGKYLRWRGRFPSASPAIEWSDEFSSKEVPEPSVDDNAMPGLSSSPLPSTPGAVAALDVDEPPLETEPPASAESGRSNSRAVALERALKYSKRATEPPAFPAPAAVIGAATVGECPLTVLRR